MKMEMLERKVRTRKGTAGGNGFLTTKKVKRQPSHIITMNNDHENGVAGLKDNLLRWIRRIA